MKMILIDAIYINTGGGKILLDYLIEELEKTNIKVFYLLDERIKYFKYPIKEDNQICYLSSAFFKRIDFYKKNKNTFSKVFCFGNVPPPIQLDVEVFTYFHGAAYIYMSDNFSLKERLLYNLKRSILYFWKKNTKLWLVQSDFVKEKMKLRFKEKDDKIKILPFFKSLNNKMNNGFIKIKNSFLYVSNAYPNKNHLRLIDAFCNFYDKCKKGKLIVTVSDNFTEVKNHIDIKIAQNYPIENLGYVSQEVLMKYYEQSEFLIFPSTSESFGLGLIEGIEFNCKIIGANLPYTYVVCEPSIVFNPLSIESIEESFNYAVHNKVKDSILKTENCISKLINLLKK